MQTLSSSLPCLTHLPLFLPHLRSPPCFPFPLLQTHSSIAGTSVAMPCTMPDVYGLLSDLPPLQAAAQIKYLTLFIPPPMPGIKNSSILCCVKSTLRKTLNILPLPGRSRLSLAAFTPVLCLRTCMHCVCMCVYVYVCVEQRVSTGFSGRLQRSEIGGSLQFCFCIQGSDEHERTLVSNAAARPLRNDQLFIKKVKHLCCQCQHR